ncbi:MAG: GNAT family N-acetyltransferase [Maribacter sp.]
MIQKLEHTNVITAEKIRVIFQASYAIEAALLKAIDFPPLQRSLANFLKSETNFFGYFQDDKLAAVIEIKSENNHTHIQSLVVDPEYFRQGIGEKLITFIFKIFNTSVYSVETGLANIPAIALYKKLGFTESKQWDTNHGVRKIQFIKRI